MTERQILNCEDGLELITGLVDDELSPQEVLSIQAHLADCPNCRWIYSEEQALKSHVRELAMNIRAPAVLKERILREQRRSLRNAWLSELWRELPRIPRMVAQTALIAALIVLPVLSARYWLTSPYIPIAEGVFQSYTQIAQGMIRPITIKNITELKEQLTRSVDGKFAPMAYDLSMMGLRPVGGLLQDIANRQVLVTVYEGKGSILICYTFLGSEDDAPATADISFDAEKRMNFYQFSYGQTNAVMRRAGQVMCILVSQMPMSELLALARAKVEVI